ncbi:putative transcription factor MYB-HB-like family [Helianthus annuus]|uniref:Putative duplicated homeodomain-like superfamily protein n=1 Tax=Helianthus annuus TaxID=4232 RepID=A0A251URG4_HELAN|nr:transcription factor SRM1 [Helianthus annuus]KAF5806000.1 putative transcription factor MYB-related family [Helianthus annuus]KAJ0577132.1 putative transcription factor MYB/SANT family [Helianthus annuus]KAJ0584672.1 putative transcription factor MYB/SANT family [Helianthus annuus]KAJ0750339.1 putative transcription factor MYB/SANT family [Helianthus annuus]KAJ0789287.1 putative transcription factor MYB family [Helianthus annuus]
MYHQEPDWSTAVAAESTWSRYEDKLFEEALVRYPDDVIGRWQLIANAVPGKTPEQVRAHYEVLVHDLFQIDSGQVELPSYVDDGDESVLSWDPEFRASQISFGGKGSKNGEIERKKGTPWTEEEHRLFLIGLQRYGKGDWRSISRNVVVSRTPTQVASHAQKYFLRQNSMKKERKRSSIHDITTTTDTVVVPPPPPGSFGGGGGGSTGQLGYEHNFGYTM